MPPLSPRQRLAVCHVAGSEAGRGSMTGFRDALADGSCRLIPCVDPKARGNRFGPDTVWSGFDAGRLGKGSAERLDLVSDILHALSGVILFVSQEPASCVKSRA